MIGEPGHVNSYLLLGDETALLYNASVLAQRLRWRGIDAGRIMATGVQHCDGAGLQLTERGHHHHLVCVSCDRVEEMEIEEAGLVACAQAVARKVSFQIDDHAIEFYGRCQSCLPTAIQHLPL